MPGWSRFRAGVSLVAAAGILLVSVTFNGELGPASGRRTGRFFEHLEPHDREIDGKVISLLAVDQNSVSPWSLKSLHLSVHTMHVDYVLVIRCHKPR